MLLTHRIEDDAGVEHVLRVEQLLELPHELVSRGAPLHLHIGGHVPAGSMLTLQHANTSIVRAEGLDVRKHIGMLQG